MNTLILHYHAGGGPSQFDAADIVAYGSLDNLIASGVLAGIPGREASLAELWAAAHVAEDVEAPTESEDAAEQNEETEE